MKKLVTSFLFGLWSLSALAASDLIIVQHCQTKMKSNVPKEQIIDFINNSKMDIINAESGTEADYQMFLRHFRKFPTSLHEEIYMAGGRMHLIVGTNVTQDPSWDSGNIHTKDNRDYSKIVGTGGFPYLNIPTRLVINKIELRTEGIGHGSTDLLLHEYAHTLDNMYSNKMISTSQEWKNLLDSEPRVIEFLDKICAKGYCNKYRSEGFAELFANYHGCDGSRKQMEKFVPKVAEFFKSFSSVKQLDLTPAENI